MASTLRHRGPDDFGTWADDEAGIALGHTRLAIIDLSPDGHQPMISNCGRYVLVYNGEVYNYPALRKNLLAEGYAFRGNSDTEVVLAALACWGVRTAAQRFVGMFALALWDRKIQRLTLLRDRLGIKPLYYGWVAGNLVFGSELKALRTYPGFSHSYDPLALHQYLHFGYVPAPLSIYQGVRKLPPGTFLQIDADEPNTRPSPKPYWSLNAFIENNNDRSVSDTAQDSIDRLDGLLHDAVRLRLVADVPLGAFLSGGIDSSTIVAIMQSISSRPVNSFSIGFRDADYNEAEYAAAVARHLGTNHTELYVSDAEAMAVVSRMPEIYDEPFADSSQIPTFLVSRLARESVTVSLSGDGGDELFMGYSRYLFVQKLWQRLRHIPQPIRASIGSMVRFVPAPAWDTLWRVGQTAIPNSLRKTEPGSRIHHYATSLAAPDPVSMHSAIASLWPDPSQSFTPAWRISQSIDDPAKDAPGKHYLDRIAYLDAASYLPDDILTKVDRSSMAVGLEARVPILDHRLVEFALQLPVHLKIRDGQGKWVLRKVLERYVPSHLIDRPKKGFTVPLAGWLRTGLRPWAADLLSDDSLRRDGYWNAHGIQEMWTQHQAGRHDWSGRLWPILMFQAWLREN